MTVPFIQTPVTLVVAVLCSAVSSPLDAAGPPPGEALYRQYCASCHGVSLEGQLDWMRRKPDGRLPAPPHDRSGHTWHHSDRQLFTIVKFGLQAIAPGYESDMPSFDGTLSDRQITDILEYLAGTWPEREREYQRARSVAEPTSGPMLKPTP